MSLAHLITAEELALRLGQSNLRILDCRFALEDPGYGRRVHSAGHLPGACFADLEADLSAPMVAGRSGRHPLPDAQRLCQRLRQWGVDDDSEIVLYDDGPGAFAARAWWLLLWLGKREGVYLLDGGLNAWRAAGLPLENGAPLPTPGNFAGQPDDGLVIESSELLHQLADPALILIDARGLPRFRGEVEPIDPVAGHIPGAQCAPFIDNLDDRERFLPAEALRQRFSSLIGSRSPQRLVAYCGSGVTACHNLFALCRAGYPLGRLYAGSWSEWITDPSRPVIRDC
ncbi:sulfurtransferase [Pseudomonas stutzeri]|nr:sulfurtransferase [Stutzerimonas stutzeri]